MRSLVLVLVLLATSTLIGCGSDACEDAAAKLEDCGEDAPEPKSSVECTGESECVAQCFLDYATCEDLQKTIMEATPEYRDCHLGCASE